MEHRQRSAAARPRRDVVVLPLIHRKVARDVHKCATIHIVYRISNPIYHNPRTIMTQITYCTDYVITSNTKYCQMQCSWYMWWKDCHHSISIKYELNFATSWWIGKLEISTQYLYTSMCENCVGQLVIIKCIFRKDCISFIGKTFSSCGVKRILPRNPTN